LAKRLMRSESIFKPGIDFIFLLIYGSRSGSFC
jgi:hypothetical protein